MGQLPGAETNMNAKLKQQIAQHPFLRSLPQEHLAIMMHQATEKVFNPGEIILSEGEPANLFYLINSGRVAIAAGAPDVENVQTLGPGEVLGWSWLFPPFCWHFTASAMEPTSCIVLDGGHLLVTAEENPKFGYDLMRLISQILVGRLQATRKKMRASSLTSANENSKNL